MELSTGRMGPVSGVTFIYVIHVGHSTLADHGWRPDPPGSLGFDIDVCRVDGGRSRISISTHQGGIIDVYRVDGGRSRISVSILPGARR
jgi:hypothetical protein